MSGGYRQPFGVEPEKPDEEPDPGRRIMPLSVSPSERREVLEDEDEEARTRAFPDPPQERSEQGDK